MKNKNTGADLGDVSTPIERGNEPLTDHRVRAPQLGPRPIVIITPQEHEVVEQALVALAHDEQIFQRAGKLVHIVRDATPRGLVRRGAGTPRIARVKTAHLRERLSAAVHWVKIEGGGTQVAAHPPDFAVQQIEARGQWPKLRVLHAVVETPVLRPDGTVLSTPGYDEDTGIFLEPATGLDVSVPEHPTLADAQEARDILFGLVSDFPFATEGHRAAWLASLLTLFARLAFDGQAPLFLLDANTRGAGKSLLADVTGLIATGREMARMTYDKRDEEMEKRITAVALAGDQVVLLDNVTHVLGCQSLDAALTGRTWKSRILGTSETTGDLPLTVSWFATGNNVAMGADTARRTVHIRLKAAEEHPEDRTVFRHADLLAHARLQRGRFVSAALTILRAFSLADARPKLPAWGSFEAWSRSVRAAVVWVGCDDPASTRLVLREQADGEAAALRDLLTGILRLDPAAKGITANRILAAVSQYDDSSVLALREAIEELVHTARTNGLPSSKQLGKALSRFRDRAVSTESGVMALECRDRTSPLLWYVRRVSAPVTGSAGFAGFDEQPDAPARVVAPSGDDLRETHQTQQSQERGASGPSHAIEPQPVEAFEEGEL